MIDVHCHIMPCVDDGSKNLNESLVIFRKAFESGVTDIVLTPHYIKDTKYSLGNVAKFRITAVLREALRRENLPINLHYGNEVYIDPELPELIARGEVATLADSRYLLLELPVVSEDNSALDLIFRLKSMGITPIIAHPERYNYFQDRPERVERYLELGCLLQADYQSLLGKYGKKAKKTLKTLLKQDKISLLASDIHHKHHNYRLKPAESKVKRIVGAKRAEELFVKNPAKVIKNELI